jgi:hypothetical protein
MDHTTIIAPCGLDCSDCQMFKAKHSIGLRISISDKTGIPINRAFCSSCRGEDGVIGSHKITEACAVSKCSRERSVQFCCDCEDFPCSHYQPYAHRAAEKPHNLKVYNLCLIKKMGAEKFATTMYQEGKKAYFMGKMKFRPFT